MIAARSIKKILKRSKSVIFRGENVILPGKSIILLRNINVVLEKQTAKFLSITQKEHVTVNTTAW